MTIANAQNMQASAGVCSARYSQAHNVCVWSLRTVKSYLSASGKMPNKMARMPWKKMKVIDGKG
jgi:hypothetical protein